MTPEHICCSVTLTEWTASAQNTDNLSLGKNWGPSYRERDFCSGLEIFHMLKNVQELKTENLGEADRNKNEWYTVMYD